MHNMSITLDDGLMIDALPKPIRIALPGNTLVFSRNVVKTADNNISVQFVFNVNSTKISSIEYALVKGFYATVMQLLNEPILLKAKP